MERHRSSQLICTTLTASRLRKQTLWVRYYAELFRSTPFWPNEWTPSCHCLVEQ
jgi:hypothetical protein